MILRLLVLSILGSVATPAWGWGRDGHVAVCEIAFAELTEPTRKAVVDLIRHDPSYRTFREACTWADTEGRLQERRRPEHYVNVPRDWTGLRGAACPQARTCLLSAIERDTATLRSPEAELHDRLIALRSLGHWIADLHQPLHVSYRSDRGGSIIPVGGDPPCSPTLHAVWDTCLPRYLIERTGAADAAGLGRLLQRGIAPQDRARWLAERAVTTWAGESLRLARDPSVGYCDLRDGTDDCIGLRRGYGPIVDDDYLARHSVTAKRRLQQAGVRLAAMLEDLLSVP